MPISAQPRGERIDFAPRRAVDDAGLAAVPLENVEQLLLQRRARQHAVEQVGPIERADELDRVVQPELRGDVAPHARGGRGGVRVQADRREAADAAGRADDIRA